MKKNPHSKILKRKLKEQHLNTIRKSYLIDNYLDNIRLIGLINALSMYI